MQAIRSNQPHEHYVEQGYVNVGSAQVKIRRDRVNKDFIYEYVVVHEVPVSFNEDLLADGFVEQMRKYISRYGAPKLSRVAFFGTRADGYTSGKFFDDHDIIKRSGWPSRIMPRFAFNWEASTSLTWFTQTTNMGLQAVFEIAALSGPSTLPPKFSLGEQVVFHTTLNRYTYHPEIQHKVVEQISWEEGSNHDKKWYLVANKSTLRDTDWLYRVEGIEYYFREEDLAGFSSRDVSTEFLQSVDYRTQAGQELCESFGAQGESFKALLKNPNIRRITQETDLDIIKNLQVFDGITCGVERINGSGSNWFRLKFARVLPMIRYRRTPQSINIQIAGVQEYYSSVMATDKMIEAVHDGSKWTVNTQDTEMMICLDMALGGALTYIQLESGFDDINSFKKSIPFGFHRDKIPKKWLEDREMRASADNSVTERNRKYHESVMPVLFYEVSFLHTIEKPMIQIDTQVNLQRAKEKFSQGPVWKGSQIESIVENGLEETIATLYEQSLPVQNKEIGSRPPGYYVFRYFKVRLEKVGRRGPNLVKFTRKACLVAYKNFYDTAVFQVRSQISVFNQIVPAGMKWKGFFQNFFQHYSSNIRPQLLQEAFRMYLLGQANGQAEASLSAIGGESKSEVGNSFNSKLRF